MKRTVQPADLHTRQPVKQRHALLPPTPTRTRIMSAIRGRGNRTTELALARCFRQSGIVGWRRHYPIAGKPDFAFGKQRLAIFVDGCFWHGCPRCYRAPSRNEAFWAEKIKANRGRDRRVSALLRRSGWTVIRVWEHALISPTPVLRRVHRALLRCAQPSCSRPE